MNNKYLYLYYIIKRFFFLPLASPAPLPSMLCISSRRVRPSANQMSSQSPPANGVSQTSPLPSPSPPITVLSACGCLPLLLAPPPPCCICQRLPWKHWRQWGVELVGVPCGPWRTGRPRPVWALITGWSAHIFKLTSLIFNELMNIHYSKILHLKTSIFSHFWT